MISEKLSKIKLENVGKIFQFIHKVLTTNSEDDK